MITDHWARSSRCEAAACIEIRWITHATTPCEAGDCQRGEIHVRDSKLGDNSPILTFTAAEWKAFTAGIKNGDFDL